MSTDIGLNPPDTRHDRVIGGKATATGIKFGHVVIKDTAATGRRDCKLTSTAGDKPVMGVVVSQTDPTNGSAVGDDLEICDAGIVECYLEASSTIVFGDVLITSATPGCVKKLAAEGTYDIVGRAHQDMISGATLVRIAVELNAPFATK